MPADLLRRTPLFECHLALGARMVPFAGWEMPVQYAGIVEETLVVRKNTGIFDISHMGRVHVTGLSAESFLDHLTPNRIRALEPGQAHYSLLLREDGGILDDIIVYRQGPQEFTLVVNAANRDVDIAWMYEHAPVDVAIRDYSDETAMIAVQGPRAEERLQTLSDAPLGNLARFHFTTGPVAGISSAICRTGYTGEDGFELVLPAESASFVWNALTASSAAPCGLGARDVLRIEAGYPLYGHEIDAMTTPFEAGLMWVVDLEKGEFIGREGLIRAKSAPARKRLAAFRMTERAVPRHGYTVYREGRPAGIVTSGAYSPTAQMGLGMAYLEPRGSSRGARIEIEIRERRFGAVVVSRKELLQPAS